MPSEREQDALESIKRNIEPVRGFVAGMQVRDLESDLRTLYAIIRAFEIISEASRRLSDDLKERHPEVRWRAIRDAGNVYRHGYDQVAVSLVWDTACGQLDGLWSATIQELERGGPIQPRREQAP